MRLLIRQARLLSNMKSSPYYVSDMKTNALMNSSRER